MLGLSWSFIAITLAVMVTAGFFLLPRMLDAFLKIGFSQAGEFAQWHMTVKHDPSNKITPHDYWTTAINHIEEIGGELNRCWNSHGSSGDRLNREYNLNNELILLEYDRWNGFTISGRTGSAKPLAESINSILRNAV